MAASLRDTSFPLRSSGAVSAIYKGATCMAVPIPNPKISLPTNTRGRLCDKDCNSVPAINNVEAVFNSNVRPIFLSPRNIRRPDAAIAPNKLVLARRPSWNASKFPNSVKPVETT